MGRGTDKSLFYRQCRAMANSHTEDIGSWTSSYPIGVHSALWWANWQSWSHGDHTIDIAILVLFMYECGCERHCWVVQCVSVAEIADDVDATQYCRSTDLPSSNLKKSWSRRYWCWGKMRTWSTKIISVTCFKFVDVHWLSCLPSVVYVCISFCTTIDGG
jgi:hypothetical protein